MNHKTERDNDLNKILNSTHIKKVVVGGPGTGKSYLFEHAIKKEKENGKKKFLAITFVGKLGDQLADDLAGLAETMTLHGFARQLVLNNCPDGWEYYPSIMDIIKKDLEIKGITSFSVGDVNYKERTKYYKAVGDDDVISYALEIYKKTGSKIPIYDLILVDEYQDFNELESQLIDILSTKNKMLIVGDDDQALYGFKGSSPLYIREKYDKKNTVFESHTLRFCSRCTKTIVSAFHCVVNYYDLNKEGSKRIKKDYICYEPGKLEDNNLNPKILVSRNTKIGSIPYFIRRELEEILQGQKIKSVLVIGEARSTSKLLSFTANKLNKMGFKNIDYFDNQDKMFYINKNLINGYKILTKGKNDILAWRILSEYFESVDISKNILDNYDQADKFINSLPKELKSIHEKNAKTLSKLLYSPSFKIKEIADSTISDFQNKVALGKKGERDMLINQVINENKNLSRPLGDLDITICSILGSKGLGADVVFLLGFDQGKIPAKKNIEESEIYQFLVVLTRAKKRIYLINTVNCQLSSFIESIDKNLYKII